jgi:hypothetical protein
MDALVNDGLPAFIEWEIPDEELPGRTGVGHEVEVLETRVTVSGDSQTLNRWVEGTRSLEVHQGAPGLAATVVTDRGALVI